MRSRLLAPWVVAPLLVAACASEAEGPGGSDAAWRTSAEPVETGGLVWASDSTVHLADGTEIDIRESIAAYVVAGDGFYFVEKETADTGVSSVLQAELRYADRDGEVRDTGMRILVHTLKASPDGRHLAVVDMGIGEEDDYGTRQAVVRVFDLHTGEEAVRSTDGMGDPGSDDFAAVYPGSGMDVVAVTEDTAYVETLEGTLAFDLATGDAREASDGEVPERRDHTSPVSPDGTWRIVHGPRRTDLLVSDDGRRVRPRAGADRWDLHRWVDASTVVGTAIRGPGSGERLAPQDSLSLMSCAVPSGECTVFEQSAGRSVLFPLESAGGVVGITLRVSAS